MKSFILKHADNITAAAVVMLVFGFFLALLPMTAGAPYQIAAARFIAFSGLYAGILSIIIIGVVNLVKFE